MTLKARTKAQTLLDEVPLAPADEPSDRVNVWDLAVAMVVVFFTVLLVGSGAVWLTLLKIWKE